MAKPGESFRDFELGGWEDEGVCSGYDEHLSAVTIQSAGALLDAAGVRKGRRVLDVATGAGYAGAMAAARGAEAIGVDFSALQLSMARNRYPAVRFEQGDADSLPFPSESFDAVVSGFGMCHFADPGKAAREAFRVLNQVVALALRFGMRRRMRWASVRSTGPFELTARSTSVCPWGRISFCSAMRNAASGSSLMQGFTVRR